MIAETVRAEATQSSAPVRRDAELASFEFYAAAVLAESARLFNAQAEAQKNTLAILLG